MSEGRIPAQCSVRLASMSTLSSDKFLEVAEIIHQTDVSQPPLSANYCNHVPFAPKLFVPPSEHKPRALIVRETIKRLNDAYRKPKQSLKTLQFHDESGHQVKSQRREAAIAILQVMTYYQDDATGRIGRQMNDGTFRDMTLAKMAEKAGLKLKRAKRAMEDILRSGYLKVIRQFQRCADTGAVRGLPSIRSFLPKFFIDLDVKGSVWTKWFSQRGWAQKRDEKKVIKTDRKKAQAMMGLIKDTVQATKRGARKFMGIIKGVPSVESETVRIRRIQHEQNLGRKAVELFNLDPSKSISEYLLALREAHPFK
jgi:hypothetical protein